MLPEILARMQPAMSRAESDWLCRSGGSSKTSTRSSASAERSALSSSCRSVVPPGVAGSSSVLRTHGASTAPVSSSNTSAISRTLLRTGCSSRTCSCSFVLIGSRSDRPRPTNSAFHGGGQPDWTYRR